MISAFTRHLGLRRQCLGSLCSLAANKRPISMEHDLLRRPIPVLSMESSSSSSFGCGGHRRRFSSSTSSHHSLSTKIDVIAHRGASGYMPDHTLATYQSAFDRGCDWIELDAHSTNDGVLVVNHDVELSETTDVADWDWARPLRTRTKAPAVDGETSVLEGWMISDMTLDQLKRLRVKMRDDSRDRTHDLLYEVPTVEETANFVQSLVEQVQQQQSHHHNGYSSQDEWLEERNQFTLKYGYARANTNVGLYIETKRAQYYRSLGLPLEEKLVDVLESSTFQGPIIIQSFELDSLKLIRQLKPEWKTVKLLTLQDVELASRSSSHTNHGNTGNHLQSFMESLAPFCDGIGPSKRSIVPNPMDPPETSPIIAAAHAVGMFVHPYTFRTDVKHLHPVYGGNATQEFAEFFRLGVEGVFADFPDHAVYARESCSYLRNQGVEYTDFYRVVDL